MTPIEFKNMWKYIVQYILQTIPPEEHQYIIFELCNKSIGAAECNRITGCNLNAVGDKDNGCQTIYDNSYQIPTIKAIRDLEEDYNSPPHIIMVTTYNNYSGVHFWSDEGYGAGAGGYSGE